jgi:hypothetical protein
MHKGNVRKREEEGLDNKDEKKKLSNRVEYKGNVKEVRESKRKPREKVRKIEEKENKAGLKT